MRERLVTFPIRFDGTACTLGTAQFVTPVPLKFTDMSLHAKANDGTVQIINVGATAVSSASGTASSSVSVAADTVTLISGTTLFGAGTAKMLVAAGGTVAVRCTTADAVTIEVVLYALSGE